MILQNTTKTMSVMFSWNGTVALTWIVGTWPEWLPSSFHPLYPLFRLSHIVRMPPKWAPKRHLKIMKNYQFVVSHNTTHLSETFCLGIFGRSLGQIQPLSWNFWSLRLRLSKWLLSHFHSIDYNILNQFQSSFFTRVFVLIPFFVSFHAL